MTRVVSEKLGSYTHTHTHTSILCWFYTLGCGPKATESQTALSLINRVGLCSLMSCPPGFCLHCQGDLNVLVIAKDGLLRPEHKHHREHLFKMDISQIPTSETHNGWALNMA